jgi:diguanylate cyclase (GGDEF)-like protein
MLRAGETDMSASLSTAFSDILNSVVSPDDLDSLLEKACKGLYAIEGYDRVNVALFDTEQKVFIERAACYSGAEAGGTYNTGDKHIPYSEENLLGQAIIHSLPYGYVTNEDPPSSEVVVPLTSRDNLIGALWIISQKNDHFEALDLKKLTDYGRVLSVAIENRILSSSGQDFRSKDTLTGLFSQRYLQARLAHEIERVDRFGGVFGLAVVELDEFVEFRKKHGHHLASEALKVISKHLTENLREVDVAARYGEKEFAVVLPHADQEQVQKAGKRIQELVQNLSFGTSNSKELKLTASVGMAVYPNDSPFKDGLLESADMALAKAKKCGNNSICTYAELAKDEEVLSAE